MKARKDVVPLKVFLASQRFRDPKAQQFSPEMGAKRITALVERDHPWATGFWDAVGYDLDGGIARYVRTSAAY